VNFFLLLFLSAGFLSCTQNKNNLSSQVVIKVNQQQITLQRFSLLVARRLTKAPAFVAKDPRYVEKIKEEVMAQFISYGLIQDWAQENKLSISSEDLEKEIQRVRQDYPDDLSFRRFLANEGLSFSDWRTELNQSLLEKAFFKQLRSKIPQPTDKEISIYYDVNKLRFKTKERIWIRQVVVSDQVKAETLLTDAQKKDLSVIASRYSITPEAKNGGLVGWIEQGTVDEFEPLFKAPLQKLQIIKSPTGFHIIRVEKKSPPGFLPLSEVSGVILNELLAQKEQAEFLAWTDRQLRNSRVFKNTALISALKIETRSDVNEPNLFRR